jgi:type II restriction enzyme
MLDDGNELLVGKEFWDFLGGNDAYEDLLDCFEQAGIILGPEIDDYFLKFKNNH